MDRRGRKLHLGEDRVGLLDGQRALVTGGASGIGLAVAQRFAAEGAALCLLDVDADAGEEAARALDAHFIHGDVGDPAAVGVAVRSAAERLGGLSVLVNNAGAGHLAPLHAHDDALWERLIRINLTGVFNCMRAALPIMRAGGGGTVVNNASGSAMRPTRGELPYSAAKAGVVALTKGAALEYAPTVRVNCVSAGVIRTPLTEPLFSIPGAMDPVYAATPLGRTGTAEEVAEAFLFLATSASSFVTGQELVVDGGMALPQAGIDQTLAKMLELMGHGR